MTTGWILRKDKWKMFIYTSGVGKMMYAMICSRIDLTYAVSVVSRYMSNSGTYQWDALNWIFRYLNGTSDLGLLFEILNGKGDPLRGYVDDDFAGNVDTIKSLIRYMFTLYGTTISWISTL